MDRRGPLPRRRGRLLRSRAPVLFGSYERPGACCSSSPPSWAAPGGYCCGGPRMRPRAEDRDDAVLDEAPEHRSLSRLQHLASSSASCASRVGFRVRRLARGPGRQHAHPASSASSSRAACATSDQQNSPRRSVRSVTLGSPRSHEMGPAEAPLPSNPSTRVTGPAEPPSQPALNATSRS